MTSSYSRSLLVRRMLSLSLLEKTMWLVWVRGAKIGRARTGWQENEAAKALEASLYQEHSAARTKTRLARQGWDPSELCSFFGLVLLFEKKQEQSSTLLGRAFLLSRIDPVKLLNQWMRKFRRYFSTQPWSRASFRITFIRLSFALCGC